MRYFLGCIFFTRWEMSHGGPASVNKIKAQITRSGQNSLLCVQERLGAEESAGGGTRDHAVTTLTTQSALIPMQMRITIANRQPLAVTSEVNESYARSATGRAGTNGRADRS